MWARLQLVLSLIVLSFFKVASQPLPALIPYVDNSKWGYCDSNGVVKIRPCWDNADFFRYGRAVVSVYHPVKGMNYRDITYCLIDEQGKYIIPPYRKWNGIAARASTGAGFNALTRKGRSVVIDSNNRELSPGIYDVKPGANIFAYRKGWSPYYKVVGRNGKRGVIDSAYKVIIPFEYDDIQMPNDIPAHYLVVVRKGKKGLIDTANRKILPCRYDYIMFAQQDFSRGMRIGLHGSHTAYANVEGQVLFDHPDYTVTGYPTDSLIQVQAMHLAPGTRHSYGIMSLSSRVVLPTVYAGAYVQGDTIVAVTDSLYREALAKEPTSHYYYRYFSRSKGSWISGWVLPPPPIVQPATPAKAIQNVKPLIRIFGRDTSAFTKDGRTWEVVERVGTYPYFTVKSIAADSDSAIAVVDTYGHFVIHPARGSYTPGRYIPSDSLLVITRNTGRDSIWNSELMAYHYIPHTESYGVVDREGRLVMPLQAYRIITAFRWEHRFYAIIATDGRNGEAHVLRLVDSTGKPVTALSSYSIEELTDRYGVETKHGGGGFDGSFEGYFRVRPTLSGGYNQASGLVDIQGKVLFSSISFAGYYFQAVGGGFFLVSRRRIYPWPEIELQYPGRKKKPEIAHMMLTDSNRKELFRDLPVVNAAPIWPMIADAAADDSKQPPPSPKLYMIQYMLDDQRDGGFYMHVSGLGYFGRLKGWKDKD